MSNDIVIEEYPSVDRLKRKNVLEAALKFVELLHCVHDRATLELDPLLYEGGLDRPKPIAKLPPRGIDVVLLVSNVQLINPIEVVQYGAGPAVEEVVVEVEVVDTIVVEKAAVEALVTGKLVAVVIFVKASEYVGATLVILRAAAVVELSEEDPWVAEMGN